MDSIAGAHMNHSNGVGEKDAPNIEFQAVQANNCAVVVRSHAHCTITLNEWCVLCMDVQYIRCKSTAVW